MFYNDIQPKVMSINRTAIKRFLSYFGCKDNSLDRRIVLTYHSVNPNHPGAVKPEEFSKQLTWLAQNCKVLTLDQLLKNSFSGRSDTNMRGRRNSISVAITFDDGYADVYHYAFPVLREFNMPATVFLVAGFINSIPPKNRGLYENLKLLSWEEVYKMQRDKVCFESHTYSHRNLAVLPPEEIKYELARSKETIENNTEKEVKYFAFPWGQPGFFHKNITDYAVEIGYEMAFTTMWGKIKNTSLKDRYFLPRLVVNPHEELEDFQREVLGYYDYIRIIDKARCIYYMLRTIGVYQ